MVLGQYGAALVGTWWYLVSVTWYCLVLSETGLVKGFYACIYFKKKVEIRSDVTIAGGTNEQGKIELLNQWTMDGWDEQQLY